MILVPSPFQRIASTWVVWVRNRGSVSDRQHDQISPDSPLRLNCVNYYYVCSQLCQEHE